MSLNSTRSANSGQKSKRSFNSNDSDDSTNKKKSKQKTLGMAWGSNSLSSSRSSFRSSPFSDFGSYMVEKNRKLQNQFDAEASSSCHGDSSLGRSIFAGVSIFVDGFTIPSSQELRGYMVKYGGRYENYFSRNRVTHIICSNLPDSKVKNLRSFSGGLPVVKPRWILDCVVTNKLLSWVPYQLDQLTTNQPKVSAFFAPKCLPVSKGLSTSTCHGNTETEGCSRLGTSNDLILADVVESTGNTWPVGGHLNNIVHEKTNSTNQEAASDGGTLSEIKNESDYRIKEEGSCVKHELDVGSCQPAVSVSNTCLDESFKDFPESTVSEPSSVRHSTLGDPNFVENYFKNSRLHFIGTWRNRYRKRFPSSTNGFNSSRLKAEDSLSPMKTTIIHIDMDCFFVSVVIRKRPDLHDKPVAVCHSNNPKGTAEISSANYPARDYRVKAGMFVRDAKARCPHLVIVPYDFEAYEEVADQFYNILHKHCCKVQAISCDEAFLDVTDLEEDPENFASNLRREIFETTGCSASTGISVNMLMSRLATRTAKPDGQCYISAERVEEYLHQLPIKALPGVGYVLEEKLKKRNIWTCGQLCVISKESLQKDFGKKTGEMLWNYSRGLDDRLVGMSQESKSVGAEVNWGVRFKDLKDTQHFLTNLCKEVSLRLHGCGVQGRSFTLKIKKRRRDAGEPAKYMGCGDCENLSHSVKVPVATDDVEVIQRIAKQLFGFFNIDVKEIRGIGLQVSKLESTDNSKQGLERYSLKSWLASGSATTEGRFGINSGLRGRASTDTERQSLTGTEMRSPVGSTGFLRQPNNSQSSVDPGLPPLCHLDIGVIESLPPELFLELNDIYSGKLVDYIAKCKANRENTVISDDQTNAQFEGELDGGDRYIKSDSVALGGVPVGNEGDIHHTVEEVKAAPESREESYDSAVPHLSFGTSDLLPSSLSQVDCSVLEQLPEELKVDLIKLLPEHRKQEYSTNSLLSHATEKPHESLDINTEGNRDRLSDHILNNQLWKGNPPEWVDKFKHSNCLTLNMVAEKYSKFGSTGLLSSILQHAIISSQNQVDVSSDNSSESVIWLCELFRQYINLKIESDIEEIYLSFRVLRRLTTKSKVFLEVYNDVLPYLQASVGEYYGGNLLLN